MAGHRTASRAKPRLGVWRSATAFNTVP